MPRMPRLTRLQPATRMPPSTVVVRFPVPESDIGLVTALRAGHPDAVRALCERHSGHLVRVAARILGPDVALTSVVTDAIRKSLDTLDELVDPRALKAWLVCRLIGKVRARLKARRRWQWLRGRTQYSPSVDGCYWSARLLASYRVLDRMPDEQRIVFCLVVIHSMGLAEVATVLSTSLVHVRRLLEKANHNFTRCAIREPLFAARSLRSA